MRSCACTWNIHNQGGADENILFGDDLDVNFESEMIRFQSICTYAFGDITVGYVTFWT